MGIVDTFMSEAAPNDERDEEPSESRTDGGRSPRPSDSLDRGLPTLEPANDETTVELVRDAIGVARGELCDEQFARKYGTASDGRIPDAEASDR